MILITGSAGFIGFHLSKYYLDKGKKVIGIDNLNNYYNVKYKKSRLKILNKYKNFNFFKIDLKNKKNLKKLDKNKKKINLIIHLAGQAGVRYSILKPSSYVKNNIEAYIYLLEYFKLQKNIKMILYASSSSSAWFIASTSTILSFSVLGLSIKVCLLRKCPTSLVDQAPYIFQEFKLPCF